MKIIKLISLCVICFCIGFNAQTLFFKRTNSEIIYNSYDLDGYNRDGKVFDHWCGKMDYYLSASEYLSEQGIIYADDKIWQEIEKRYQIKSKANKFNPYP